MELVHEVRHRMDVEHENIVVHDHVAVVQRV